MNRLDPSNWILTVALCATFVVCGPANQGFSQNPYPYNQGGTLPRTTARSAARSLPAAVRPLPATMPVAQPIAQPVTVADQNKPLGVGDQVTYSVDEDRDPPVALVVTDAGELNIPYLGRVRVVGKTCSAVKSLVKAKLEKDLYYKATVNLALDQVNRSGGYGYVYLSGQVITPGPQQLYSGQHATVGRIVLRAGGLSDFADSRRVKLIRKGPDGKGQKPIIVDLKEVLERGRVEKDVKVQDGDLIIVPQRLINW